MPSTFQWLAKLMASWIARLRAAEWPALTVVQLPADRLRELVKQGCPAGWFEFRSAGIGGHVQLRPADEIADHVRVATRDGDIPVQPLHKIEATDPCAARVLAVLRNASPGPDAAPPGTALHTRRRPRRRRYDPLEDRWF